jgi:hypothetical protein
MESFAKEFEMGNLALSESTPHRRIVSRMMTAMCQLRISGLNNLKRGAGTGADTGK